MITRVRQSPAADAGGLAALTLILVAVSTHTAMNLGGPPLVVVYAVAMACVTVLLVPVATDLLGRAPRWVGPGLVLACLAVLVTVFVVGVPSADAMVLGVGSDRANALDVALSRLAAGDYPYTGTTYLQNPITPLPGALVLAAPFWWVAGTAAWQNVGWTVLLLPVLAGRWRPRPGATVLWLLAVAGTFEVWREFLIGDDLVTGAVPTLAAVAWVLREAGRGSARPAITGFRGPVGRQISGFRGSVGGLITGVRGSAGGLAAAAVALGVTTCTRPHLALVVVIVAVAVGRRAGRRRGLLVAGMAALAWAVLIVPFLLGGVARFSPLHVAAKVTGERGLSAGIVAIAFAAALLLGGALARLRPASEEAVGWFSAGVLFAPTLLSLARSWLQTGAVWDGDLTLGAIAVPFALWAVAARERSAPVRGEEPVAPAVRGFPSRRKAGA